MKAYLEINHKRCKAGEVTVIYVRDYRYRLPVPDSIKSVIIPSSSSMFELMGVVYESFMFNTPVLAYDRRERVQDIPIHFTPSGLPPVDGLFVIVFNHSDKDEDMRGVVVVEVAD